MRITSPQWNDVLWGNNQFGGEYALNHELLAQLKETLQISLDNKNFVKLLLCVGEAESGGAIGKFTIHPYPSLE